MSKTPATLDLAGRSPYTALALCMGAARWAGWTESEIRAFRLKVTSAGSPEAMLRVCHEQFGRGAVL